MNDNRDEEYFCELSKKINKIKTKNTQRGNSKVIKYIESQNGRDVKISTRGDTIMLTAMELEMQTKVRVNVEIKNPEATKVLRDYKSLGFGGTTATPAASDEAPVSLPQTPTRGRQVADSIPSTSTSSNGLGCKVCGKTDEISYWLGCSKLNKITRQYDCNYWVHQNCVGLFYKKKTNLEKVPFYCPMHGKDQGVRSSKSTAPTALKRLAGKRKRQ